MLDHFDAGEHARMNRAYQDMANQMAWAFADDGTFAAQPRCHSPPTSTEEHFTMSKLPADQATIINEQIARINAATNHGTLDRETVNDACNKLKAMTQTGPVQNALGGNSVVQNAAVPHPHAGEPGHPSFNDGRPLNNGPIPNDGHGVRVDGHAVNAAGQTVPR